MNTIEEFRLVRNQRIQWCIRFILRLFFRVEHQKSPNVKWFDEKLIVASRHEMELDHWLLFVFFPWRKYNAMLPLRFIARTKFSKKSRLSRRGVIKILQIIYRINRTIPSDEGDCLDRAMDALLANHRVIIYPEGHTRATRARDKDHADVGGFRRGVSDLAKKSSSQVLPVSIRYEWKKFPRRTHVVVRWGEPTLLSGGSGVEDCSYLHELVSELYHKSFPRGHV